MKILLLGDFSDILDEGYKNTSHYLAAELARNNSVFRLNVKRLHTLEFWQALATIKPQIVHALVQPTNTSLIFCSLLRRYWAHSRSVVSALRADKYFINERIDRRQQLILRLFGPDLMLTQDTTSERLLIQVGCTVKRLPNGVDLERFRPVDIKQKHELRKKYGLKLDQPVVLHVGHLRLERNLRLLKNLTGAHIQVVIVGSTYLKINQDLIKELEASGIKLIKGYQPQVEEFYQLADCYVFPTEPGNSLTMPLSVLEAMACNLPVITTRFAGLENSFKGEAGLQFVEDTNEILSKVRELLHATPSIRTREMVRKFSWVSVAAQLQSYYVEVSRP